MSLGGGVRPGATRSLRADTGQALVLLVLAMTVILGMAAIVVDFGNLFVQKRSLQQAADAAALAAAQRLPGTACDPGCEAGVATLAGNYQGVNQAGAPSSPLPQCSVAVTSNCYRLLGSPPDRVEVILAKDVSTFFGGLFGKPTIGIRKRAVAAKFPYTSVQPGSTVTNPGSTNPAVTIVNTVTTAGSPAPALLFAKSETCGAINLNGAGGTFGGAVISNGGVDAPSSNIGGGPLLYGNGVAPSCLKLGNNNGWGTPIAHAPLPWPVEPPTCTPACDPTTATAKTQIATVGGVACTAKPADWTITTAPPAGLYCSRSSIDVKVDLVNVALVAPSIRVGGNVVSGYTGSPALSSYGGLVFYAYGGSAVTAPVDEVKTLTITSATGGTLTLTFNKKTTGSLAYNASATTVQTALESLSTIGAGNVTVTPWGYGPPTTYIITFVGSLGGTDVGSLDVNAKNLLPKNGASASVTDTTQGAPATTGSDTTVVRQAGNGFAFKGAIYAPFGGVELTGSGSQALCPDHTAAGCGFIEAQTARLAGAQTSWQGLGPGIPGPPTTSTTTTTTPGSTNPGSTVTNPDVTITTGTGSNLDE